MILDSQGRPVDTGKLKDEVAGPVLTGLRQVWWQSLANVLTPDMLGSILQAVDMGDAWQYLVLAYELEDRWQRYYSVLSTRKLAVSGLQFSVEDADETAPDKKIGDFVRDVLSVRRIDDLIPDAMDALSKGYACIEIMWDKEGKQWWPKEFIYRDARFFRYDVLTGQELRIFDMEDPGFGIPIPPFKMVVHQPKIKCGLPIKRGFARLALVPYLCQNYGIRDWMAFAECMGIPLRLGSHPPSATADEKAALLRAVAGIGVDHAGIIPNNMKIDFQNQGTVSGGDKIFSGMVGFFNEEMTIAILGQAASTQGTPGKLGADDAQENVREDIRTNDAKQLCATIDRDLIKPIVDLNFGPQPEGKYPTSKLTLEKPADNQTESAALSVYIDRGLRVKESDILAKFKGLTTPEDGDAVLTPAKSGGGGGQQPDGTQAAGPVAHSEEPIAKPLPPPSDEVPADTNPTAHSPDSAEKRALKIGKSGGGGTQSRRVFGQPGARASQQSPAVEKLIAKAASGIRLSIDERLALAAASGADAIDEQVNEATSRWHEVIDPMRAQVQALANASTSEADFKEKLGKLKLSKKALVDAVTLATFQMRVDGYKKDQP